MILVLIFLSIIISIVVFIYGIYVIFTETPEEQRRRYNKWIRNVLRKKAKKSSYDDWVMW